MQQETKICQNCKQDFTIEPEDFNFYEKISAQDGSASGGKVLPLVGGQGGGKCTNEFETSYAPERPEIVYCESCYQKEVY